MNKPCARITLDLQQASTPTFVAVKKSDIGREIRITLSDGGFSYEISADCYAVLTGTKPDGNILYNHCDIEGNTIVYAVTEQTTAAAGRMKAEVKLYGADDQLVTSATFRIIIDGTVYDEGKVESKDEVSALTHLVSEAAGVINNGNQMIEQGQQTIQSAETATQEATNAAEQAENSAADADAAACAATQASNDANTAAGKANTAAQNADTAASKANTAAANAGDAAVSATNAAGSATSAAGNANDAATTANAAAQNVVNAANQATAAATAANSAASNAETATRNANTATNNASAAADRANTAASEAVSAAKRAEEAADSINSSGGNGDLTGYATEQWVKDQKYLTAVPDGYAKTSEIPKKPEDIGALPNTYTPPNQTAEQVGADPKGTAASAVSQHNTADDSHGDIRLELKAINDKLTAFFDSDNQTLDELSEIVAYITSNKSLIDSITTSKVSVADIVNNLTSNVTNKPLSAAQGVVLKGLIDAVSKSLSNYQPKGEYLTEVPDGYATEEWVEKKFEEHSGGKVDKVEGKGLSSNDYDNTAKAKVDAIPENPKYTDTVYDDTEVKQGLNQLKDELMDARVDCEGKTWDNAGGHIRGITEKIIDACCDKVIAGSDNYNLFKTSEVTYKYRLQNDSEELVSSNEYNMVSGWIPVEYGKYYTFSILYNGARATHLTEKSSPIGRMHVKLLDGSVLLIQQDKLRKDITHSFSTIRANIPDMVAVRMQITMYDLNPYPSTEEIMKTYEPMFTASDASTGEEARNYALSLPYMDGDAEGGAEVFYELKSDETKADRTEVETIKSAVSALSQRKVTASPKYNGNYIPNDRFLRGIANLRDSANAKEFEITITNNSGATIKNAAIAVGLHNTAGINPDNNNLPFQIYDDVFSELTGFKFFDGSTELPYYIESESDCNYIVDRNIKTDQKTMAVFSDGKIAVYNATKARMQLSADDGVSWTNICDNITSRPYRILLPDSQDNLFVASNDGKKLYKYTSADGYKAGTEVIDLTDTDTCIGSILAEDSDGNLYLGTYQTVFHCVVRKSTDHGNTWTIVFDVTNCQHVHNIFVNKKVTPNEIFIGLDNSSAGTVETHVSTDAGVTWTKVDVPYGNRDYAFRYAGENFYIGCGERLYLGGATLYKTTDYNDPNAYYPLFDNGQGIRDIINVIDGSDDVLIAGGCVDIAVNHQQLFLSEDRGETWKTVLINPYYAKQNAAGNGLRTFSRKDNQILSQISTDYAMRFVYGNGAKTILTIVNVGDIPVEGKTITLKTGYVASIEQMEDVLTAYENIDGKVADIQICDGYIVDKVSNKRVMRGKTALVNSRIKIGQTSEYKIIAESAYRLNESVNLGKLSRLNFTKGFTVSLLFRKEDGKNYLADYNEYPIFQSGDTKLVLYRRSLILVSGSTSIFGNKLYIQDSYLGSVNEDYVRLTAYFTADELPSARIYTENKHSELEACTEYPITKNLSENDFIVGSDQSGSPNIARIEIYNRVLTHGEIMALTNGCNLVTDGSRFN